MVGGAGVAWEEGLGGRAGTPLAGRPQESGQPVKEIPIFAAIMARHPRDRNKFIDKLRNKYRLVILNDDTFEEKLSLKLSRLNVFLISGISAILLVAGTTLLIAFTPLREYIPGYSSTALKKQAYQLTIATDSLERQLTYQKRYLLNLQYLLEGREPLSISDTTLDDSVVEVKLRKRLTKPESLLSGYVEEEERFSIQGDQEDEYLEGTMRFFTPVKGLVTDSFSVGDKHPAVDIVTEEKTVVKAAQEGVVILSEWTAQTGYVLVIQHPERYVTVYKHNAALLKEQGAAVRAGESIAIVGNTGKESTGPHLHFELWYDGYPVNPLDYLRF